MLELILRFFAGGLLVSAFALLGDSLKPRTFGGLFGAAPSVALATLSMQIVFHGRGSAVLEGRSMWAGSAAFLAYAATVSWALMRFRRSALKTTALLLPLWFLVAFTLWAALLRTR